MSVTWTIKTVTDHDREADVDGFASGDLSGQRNALRKAGDAPTDGLLLPAVRIINVKVPSFLPI